MRINFHRFQYFVEAAALVLKRTKDIRFCMAGSGDKMNEMIDLAANLGIADRFHFPGFQRGRQVYECYKNSDVFVMPSVSEPFGIAPLEAMQCGCPSIISKQSGCGEILEKVIKTDYWDIEAMADAIYSICTNEGLYKYLQEEGLKEVDAITWEKVGERIYNCYKKYVSMARQQNQEIIPDKISCHSLRHSKAMHLLQAGVNLVYIRDILGHVSIQTTEIYARADSKQKREAIEKAYKNVNPEIEPLWEKDKDLLSWLKSF